MMVRKNLALLCAALTFACWQLGAKSLLVVNPQFSWQTKSESKAESGGGTWRPFIEGAGIVCGNKRISLDKKGDVIIADGAGVLAKIYIHIAYVDGKTEKTDWQSFSEQLCTMTKDGDRFIWELGKSHGQKSWKAADMSLHIDEEGRIILQATAYPPEAEMFTWRNKPQVFIFTPFNRAEGKNLSFNGERRKLLSSTKSLVSDWKSEEFEYVFYSGSPAETFTLRAATPEIGKNTTCYPDFHNKSFRTVMYFNDENTAQLALELPQDIAPPAPEADLRGGINFKRIEDISLPDSAQGSLFQNPSFERGFEGYRVRHPNRNYHWHWRPFTIDESEAFDGNNSLLLDAHPFNDSDYRCLINGANLTSSVAVVEPGKYTISLHAKCEAGKKAAIHAWLPNFHSGSLYAAFDKAAVGKFYPNGEWKRYAFTFEVKQAMPLEMHLNAASLEKDKSNVKVWIDAIQLEKGDSPSDFAPPAAEGRLLTSDPENFISATEKIQGRMLITTGKRNSAGSMALTVKNFFGELIFDGKFDFVSDGRKVAEVALPLDELPGLGVFVLRAEYRLEDGTEAYDFHRYAKVDFLTEDRPLKKMFALDYGLPELHFNFLDNLSRWRKLGVGSKQHHHIFRKDVWDTEREYGVEPEQSFMMSFLRDKDRNRIGFCIIDDEKTDAYVQADDPRILVRDFYFDSNGKITPEYLAKFKDAAKLVAAKYPHIRQWCLAGELAAKFAADWWSESGTAAEFTRIHAQLLKAFAEGVREGNPGARVFQDDPCNMRPEGGIAETARLLAECTRIGLKFDLLAIHPYRFSPESPDLDADTKTWFKMLEEHGYGDVPTIWPEGMHWGPFNIPQWGTDSSTWGGVPRTWPGALLSYDMGWTERKSAAWYARAWLVALKYSDRILGATAGNTYNNCYMDIMLTPYAAQLVPNTLGHLLGDAHFQKDIRFAPFIRVFVFSDSQNRPVAAVWCHLDKVDNGAVDAPVAEADFADSLESVIDFMNSPRAFSAGKFRFPVSSFPLFLRGKPGTLATMTAALEQALVVSGEGVSPLAVSANPLNEREALLTLNNFLSHDFKGRLNGQPVSVPGSGSTSVKLPLPARLRADKVTALPLPARIDADSGASYSYDLSFEALLAKKVPATADFSSIDWSGLPSTPFERNSGDKTSGSFRLGWNSAGLFVEVTVNDSTFVHVEYEKTEQRWNNDCLQLYIDTMANARTRSFKGYDEDDYDYAIFPNAAGDGSIVFRYRSVEQQLGLATEAPRDMSIAEDILSSFSNRNGVLTYRVFIQAKYLLPMRLEKGWCFGLGLYAANADQPGKVDSALTLSSEGGGCYNRPHTWPAVLLVE
jgi:hypothetical protein